MKKKVLLGFFGCVIIVVAIYVLKEDTVDKKSGTVTEQDRPIKEKDTLGDGMIWESLSRHFMTIN